jgi:tetratricopeptide (TPR) repeat protein
MSGSNRIRLRQIIREAEGYLELGMPRHALETLDRLPPPGTFRAHALYLRGEALRALDQYEEAIGPLAAAAELAPGNIHIWLALGWCHKRTGRLDLAIKALESARDAEPDEALIQYNLACYWSLAGGKRRALDYLARAFTLDGRFRDMVHEERDFDPIRSDPEFQALAAVIC